MKKNLSKCFFLILLIFALLIIPFYKVYADDINLDITDPSFSEEFKPSDSESGITSDLASPFVNTIVQVVNPILGILQVIGILLSVVSLSFFGLAIISSNTDTDLLGSILPMSGKSSPEATERFKIFFRNFFIGAFFLVSSTTIVKIVFKLFMNSD